MDFDRFLYLVLIVFTTIILYRVQLWLDHKEVVFRLPYKYKCSVCSFAVNSNDPVVLGMFVGEHEHKHSAVNQQRRKL